MGTNTSTSGCGDQRKPQKDHDKLSWIKRKRSPDRHGSQDGK